MARFTLWDCSKAVAACLAGACALAGPGLADSRWRQGVFPVAVFSGYTSHFGQRLGPSGSWEPHHGLDIAAPMGSPIRNWWGGVVTEVINDGRCGLGLVIQSGPYEHLYCHLSGAVQDGTYRRATGPLR
ncbi:MAG: M23 family metallopeptidase, partial [Vulcanococcus sp.]